MTLPTVMELALALAPIKAQAVKVRAAATLETKPEEWHIPVWVQVCEDGVGGWALRTGEIQFDDCHEGYMGTEYVDPRSDLKVVAASILEEITDHMHVHGE